VNLRARLSGWRRGGSTFGLVISACLMAAGSTFAEFGTNLVFASWGFAAASALLCATWRRVVVAVAIGVSFMWYIGVALILMLLVYEGVREARRY
jgi:hypothetical protein